MLIVGELINTSRKAIKAAVEAKTEDGKEYLDINGRRYFKIKVFDHDAYQCIFDTHGSWGSDIIHFDDRCDFCKNRCQTGCAAV